MTKTATIRARQKWEYLTVVRKTETYLVDELNQTFGQEGWELVSVIHGKDRKGEMAWTAFLKRPFVPGHGAPGERAGQVATEAARREPEPGPVEPGSGFDLEGDEFQIKEEPS